jgi:hypothetical protein
MKRSSLVAVVGGLLVLGMAVSLGVYVYYQETQGGLPKALAAFEGKGLVTEDLKGEVRTSATDRPHVIIGTYMRPDKAYSVQTLQARAQSVMALGVSLQAYGFEFEREGILPFSGYLVGRVPLENVDQVASHGGVRAITKNDWISIGGSNFGAPLSVDPSAGYMGTESLSIFHESDALPSADGQVVTVVDSGAAYADWVENEVTVSGEKTKASFYHGAVVQRVVKSVAPNATINSVRVFDDAGTARLSTIIKGMEIAATMKPRTDVMNLSLGSDPQVFDPLEETADSISREYGIEIVCAAGNTMGGPETSPATAGSTLSVGALSADGTLANYSARDYDVLAVGTIESPYRGLSVETMGTSFSSPVLAGLTARYSNLDGVGEFDVRGTMARSVSGLQEADQLPVAKGSAMAQTSPVDEESITSSLLPALIMGVAGIGLVVAGVKMS